MSTTTMHFGPEWMRTKHQAAARTQPPPSPPLAIGATQNSHINANNQQSANVLMPGASTYSALVSSAPHPLPEWRDDARPFRYSKDELLKIYREGGGRGGLGLEVERWEGVVREAGNDPIGLREMDEAEKKLFAGPLNSELRRRQSTTDFQSSMSPTSVGIERPRLGRGDSTVAGSPLRERFGNLMGRRRDSTDGPTLTIPGARRLSTSGQAPLPSPRDTSQPSARPRLGVSPSFDGILNGGDGWVARRRASESLSRTGGGTNGVREETADGRAQEIREEDESGVGVAKKHADAVAQRDAPAAPEASSSAVNSVATLDSLTIGQSLAGRSSVEPAPNGASSGVPAPAPLATIDLASVEWSYLDPQGQVQGPFRADLMQKWYDDGYFAPDLLMKRTNIDVDWLRVDDLARRAAGGKLFLSLPAEALPPPGLSRRTDSPLPGIGVSPSLALNGPYQPSPIRTLRTATLDSYITNAGSSASASPSSSFGGARFGNGSPDPVAFGGRAAGYVISDSTLGSRSPFSAAPDPLMYTNARREAFDANAGLGLPSQVFGNLGRTRPVDNYAIYNNGGYQVQQSPWTPPANVFAGGTFDEYNGGRSSVDSMPYVANFVPQNAQNPLASTNSTNNIPIPGSQGTNSFQETTRGISATYESNNSLNQSMTAPATTTSFNEAPFTNATLPASQCEPPASASIPSSNPQLTDPVPVQIAGPSQPSDPTSVAPQSRWNTEGSGARRPGPFEPAHPKTTNTKVASPVVIGQPSPWARAEQASQPSANGDKQSPWVAASQDVAADAWKEPPGPNSLTVSNLGQHNEQQQQMALAEAAAAATPGTTSAADLTAVASTVVDPPAAKVIPAPEPPAATVVPPVSTSQSRRKSTTQQTQKPVSAASAPPIPPKHPSPPPTPQTKAPWANDDDSKKSKPSGITLNLREIQEAEAKKSEARKAAERERERVRASATPAATSEDVQAFTASWGLPTSQTGTRGNATPQKETGPAGPTTPAVTPPVWTTTPKTPVAKKSMKEIQEEEERRKKLAVKETTAAAAARRAYAETTTKTAPPSILSMPGSAWTVVGPSGKSSAVVAVPARPAVSQQSSHLNVSAASSAPRANGIAAARPSASVVAKAGSPTTRLEDYPINPSRDFLKWLNDSLKGLNNSVNVEEIMSMLLSFPLDPDPSTTEIISDLIYEHSTVLDGRRFAAEFVSKRKADVASRPKGAVVSGATNSKPISIAEVVKAQPKPTQPEWGGFKVVNKKKKGGKA